MVGCCLFIICGCGYFAYMYAYALFRMQYPWRPEEGIRFSGTVVKNGCELPQECWESNLSSPGEQSCEVLIVDTFKSCCHPRLRESVGVLRRPCVTSSDLLKANKGKREGGCRCAMTV